MPFSTALAGSLPARWLHMAQTICQKSMTQETSLLPQSFERRMKRVSVGQDDIAFDEILQLPDVSRPRMAYQHLHHVCRNAVDLLVHAFRVDSHKVPHQRQEVSAPVAQ